MVHYALYNALSALGCVPTADAHHGHAHGHPSFRRTAPTLHTVQVIVLTYKY